MGPDDDDTTIPFFFYDAVQLLVDSLVPSYLRPWLADHNFGFTGYNYSKLGWG